MSDSKSLVNLVISDDKIEKICSKVIDDNTVVPIDVENYLKSSPKFHSILQSAESFKSTNI